MIFKASKEMKIHIVLFQFTTSCSLVGRHHRFGGTYYLHLQGRILASEGGSVTTQKIHIHHIY